jgi:pimeloyl-ACP methyl ester carboxylesterase
MGSLIAQELALTNPDKVSSLVLHASSCGGQEAVPPSPEVIQTYSRLAYYYIIFFLAPAVLSGALSNLWLY